MRILLLILLLPSLAAAGTLKGIGGIESEPHPWTEFSSTLPEGGFETVSGWNIDSNCVQSSEQAAVGTYSLKCTAPFVANFQNGIAFGSLGKDYSLRVYPGADATGNIYLAAEQRSRGIYYGGLRATIGDGWSTAVSYTKDDQVVGPDLKTYKALVSHTSGVFANDLSAGYWVHLAGGNLVAREQWATIARADDEYNFPGMEVDTYYVGVEGQNATGTWYIDEVKIIPTKALIRNFIKHPNFRGILWSDWPQLITGVVEVNAPEGATLTDYKAVIRVYKVIDGGTNTLEDTITISTFDTTHLAEGSGDFSFDATPYNDDDELVFVTELQLKADDSVAFTANDWRVVLKNKTVRDGLEFYFDTDNKIVEDGQRKFVMGAYDGMTGARCSICLWTDKDKYVNDMLSFDGMTVMENYEHQGFNTSLYFTPMSGANPGFNSSTSDWSDPGTYDATVDSMNPWVSAVNDVGVSHLQITNNLYSFSTWRPGWASSLTDAQMWQMYASYPKSEGFLGYYTADETESSANQTESLTWDQYEVLREYDPYHPTLGVLRYGQVLLRWKEFIDIVSNDPYPIGRGLIPSDDLFGTRDTPRYFQVPQHVRLTEETSYDARPHWAVLQLFYQSGLANWPTYDEQRIMAWSSIIEGADGILWWTHGDIGLTRAWFLYSEYQKYLDHERIVNEIMAIESVLLGTDITDQVSCDNSNIAYRALTDGVDTYIMARNNLAAAQSGVTFSHSSIDGGVEVYTESRTIAPNGTSFSDTFGIDYDVHVYKISSVSVNFTEQGITNFKEATGDVFFNQ